MGWTNTTWRILSLRKKGLAGPSLEDTAGLLAERELDLRSSNERLDVLLDSLPVLVFSADAETFGATYVSRNCRDVTGFDPDEMLSRPHFWIERIHPDDRASLLATEHPENGAPLHLTYRWRVAHGAYRWFGATVRRVRSEDGAADTVVGVVRDITSERDAGEELQRSLEQLRRTDGERRLLLQRLVNAQEEERRRIAADIHDDPLQTVVAGLMRVAALRRSLPPEQQPILDKLEEALTQTVSRLRRLISELQPPALERVGLEPALRTCLEGLRVEGGPDYRLRCDLQDEPPAEERTVLYRIAQEALTNVRKHARADLVEVTVAPHDGGILLTVGDDGAGFDPAGGSPSGHIGLTSMRERAESAGGRLTIESARGSGSIVSAWLPLQRVAIA